MAQSERQSDMPVLMTAEEACSAIGGSRPISTRSLRRLVARGHISVVRPLPGVVRYDAATVRAFLASVTFPAPQKTA